MTRLRPTGLWPLLLLIAPAFAGAAEPAPADDVDAQWRHFLATAESDAVYEALSQAVGDLDFAQTPSDALCRERAEPLQKALALAPVSIAAEYFAFQCAQVLGDEAAADRHLASLGGLARHALAQASDDWMNRPIRVVGGFDIYALVAATGLQFRREILMPLPQRRHLVYRVIAWDPEARQERHLYIDFADTVVRLSRNEPASAYPSYRQRYADNIIDSLAKVNSLAGLDLKLTREALGKETPQAIVAGLRPMAERAGYHASFHWLETCRRAPFEGCGEGLVDALLPQAEERHVMPTLLLALAYLEGVGVPKDEAAALQLLDAADREWGEGRADVQLVWMHRMLGAGPIPAALAKRLEALSAAGKPLATVLLAHEALDADDVKRLPEAMVPALEAAARQGSVSAMRTLGLEFNAAGEAARAMPWLRMAAEAGDVASQEIYGSKLYFGRGVPRDVEAGRRWWRESAEGGDVDAIKLMAWQAELREAWPEAFDWYASASMLGDDEGTLGAAALLEQGAEGLSGGPERAGRIYEGMLRGARQAEARRRLSQMHREGNGFPKDLARARQLLEEDAAKDDRQSQLQLAVLLMGDDLGEPDPAAGKAWFERAMASGDGEAFDAYATYLYYTEATPEARREAMRLWRESMQKPGEWGLNNAAWVQCVSPMDELRTPAEGLALAKRMGDPADLPAAKLDTLAACHAANEDFASAIRWQQAAVDWMAEYAAGDPSTEGMRERLARYQAKQPFVETDRGPEVPEADADAAVEADAG